MYAYIHSLTGNADTANDVLQETNRVLWEKADEFDHAREFLPWAFGIAYNQVRAARSRARRERLVFQDEETIRVISDEWAAQEQQRSPNDRQVALDHCMQELSDDNRQVLQRYYELGESVEKISQTLDKRANSIAVMLHRVRQSLARCIRQNMTTAKVQG
jgi:RNA polymerase sigma-70 factor (ECF subfamily)